MGLINEREYKKIYISGFGFGAVFLSLRKINKWVGCVKYGFFFPCNISNAYHYHSNHITIRLCLPIFLVRCIHKTIYNGEVGLLPFFFKIA